MGEVHDGDFKLTTLLQEAKTVAAPRNLQTAIFWGQAYTGCELYRFRVSRGKVLSDELDQEVAQLEAAGWVGSGVFST